MLDNLTGLAVFAKVVEQEGFSRAAEALRMSKSAVSKQVAALEDRLGTRLLNRTTRRLSLTETGARLYERSQRILAEAEAAELEAGQMQSQPTGTLRLSAGMSFGHQHLAGIMPTFLERYPALSVDLVLNDRVVDLIEEGYDLALRIGELQDSTLMARKLSPIRIVTIAAPAYLAASGEPAHPNELKNHACLGYTLNRAGQNWRFSIDGSEQRVRFEARSTSNNGEANCRMVENGLGIAQLPTFLVADALRAGTVVEVLRDFRPAPTGLHAVFPHGRNLSMKTRVLIDYVAEVFTAEPYWDVGIA